MNIIFLGKTRKRIRVRIRVRVWIRVRTRVKSTPGDDIPTSQYCSYLQSIQNFACRIVNGARKYDHVTPILKDLNWLPVTTQLYYRSSTIAFKCMTGRVPTYISSQFIKCQDISNRDTRKSQQLNIPLFETATGHRTFYYKTVSIWNSLDSS